MAKIVEQSSSMFVDARISFSNDFADTQQQRVLEGEVKYKEAPVSSDFKFNVENYGFISSADEIFFGGVLLPLEKTQKKLTNTTTTLREELSAHDSDSKSSRSWWKLGLTKTSKKFHSNLPHKSQNCLASILESDD